MLESPLTGLTEWDIIIRLVLIIVLAGVIGVQREYFHRPAGLRTNVMVGIGATLFTLAAVSSVDLFPMAINLDPGRILAGIVTGIGFLGAGTILFQKDHTSVIGLTTAATLWVVAGLGIAVGMGLYTTAILTTAVIMVTFYILNRVVKYVRAKSPRKVREDIAE